MKNLIIAVVAMLTPTLALTSFADGRVVSVGQNKLDAGTPKQKIENLADLAVILDNVAKEIAKDGNPTVVARVFVASVTRPGEVAFVVFEKTTPKGVESFGLLFMIGSNKKWTVIEEDFN